MDIPSPTSEQERTERLLRSLTNQPPLDDSIVARFEIIRDAAQLLGREIMIQAPHCRERSEALTRLEDTVMWAIKAVAVHQPELLAAEGL